MNDTQKRWSPMVKTSAFFTTRDVFGPSPQRAPESSTLGLQLQLTAATSTIIANTLITRITDPESLFVFRRTHQFHAVSYEICQRLRQIPRSFDPRRHFRRSISGGRDQATVGSGNKSRGTHLAGSAKDEGVWCEHQRMLAEITVKRSCIHAIVAGW